MGEAGGKVTTIVDRHPWAVMAVRVECETCMRMFKWTALMERLCVVCRSMW